MTNSVTRLEQLAACAFAHFAMYGLRLRERELYGVKPADLGILFHRSLELFSRRIAVSDRDWTELTEQEETILMEQCVDEVSEKYGADALHSDARSAYTINRLKRILCRSAWVLHEQLAAGSFRPSGFEVSFADAGNLETVKVSLGEHGRMHLQGRIDRIDTAQTEDAVYVKVVDETETVTPGAGVLSATALAKDSSGDLVASVTLTGPAAGAMTFNVTGDTLNAILNQRSQDMLTANNWNVVQYAVLTHMMAQVAGLKVGELVHVIADCHIYDRHIPAVKAMLELDGYPTPTFRMDESITDFYAFTKDSFSMENYQFHPFNFEIPMAI